MKFIALSLLLCLSSLVTQAQRFSLAAYKQMPNYETVVNSFCDKYQFTQNENNTQLRFAKKPDGWYVLTFNYLDNRVVTEELFWQNGSFLSLISFKTTDSDESDNDLNLPKTETTPLSPLAKQLLTNQLISDFKRHPFFGYDYWAEDVIQNFEPLAATLNDTFLYGLGRSYGALATNMVTNQFQFKSAAQIKFVEGGNCITHDQKNELIGLMRKSQFYFNKVYEVNKDFCVAVGTIHTKRCNEYMDLFYKLWPLTSITEAATYVPDNLYTPNVLSEARNYLNSCDSNAIFFAWGDNDTYPLHYLQIKENVREDVTIINMGMLGVYLWIDAQTRGWNNKGIAFSIPFSSYKEGFNYITINPQNINQHVSVRAIPALRIGENRALEADFIVIPFNQYTLEIDLSKKPYLLDYELAALDIIASNPNRPICFSQEIMTENLGLKRHVQFNGFTYSLIKTETPEVAYDIEKMKYFYEKVYTLEGFDNFENFSICDDYYQNALGYYTLYANLLQIASSMLNDDASKDEVKVVINQLDEMERKCCFEMPESYVTYKKYVLESSMKE